MLGFDTFVYTNEGSRMPNEDSADCVPFGKHTGWIAADGLGGHVGGEIASAEAVQSMKEALLTCPVLTNDSVQDILQSMNRSVMALLGPLTTAVCAFSDGKNLFYANNGDSRLYFLRNKKIERHTHDHNLAYKEYLQGKIQYEKLPLHPQQNKLTHCLGSDPDYAGEFYEPIELRQGDAFVLCTDGFWELVSPAEIEKSLKLARNAEDWFSLLKFFIDERLTGTSDNYTVILVQVKEL